MGAIDWITAVYYNPSAQIMRTFFMNTFSDALRLFVPSYKLCDNLVTRNSKPIRPLNYYTKAGASIPIYRWRQMRQGQFGGGGFIKSLTNFSIQKSI